jgi:hypothetical protein
MDQDYSRLVAPSVFAYQSAVMELHARVEDCLAQVVACVAAVETLRAASVRSSELPTGTD